MIIIAESLKHNYDAVYQFQQELFKYLKEKFRHISKIFFFSDGAAGQYKNKKNFYQLCQYKKVHNFHVEWHFFATSHGKGPCDGIGGAFKRNATRASQQIIDQGHITNAKELYDWAISKTDAGKSNIIYRYCTAVEYKKVERQLSSKFAKVHSIEGTQKNHCYIPINDKQIKVKRYSTSDKFEIFDLLD